MTASAVTLTDGGRENALACMLADLVEQTLEDEPRKRKVLDRMVGRVAIIAEDAETSVTLRFRNGVVEIDSGIVGIPDLTLRGSSEDILRCSQLRLGSFGGLPDPRDPALHALGRALVQRRLRTYGAVPNVLFAARLMRLLAVG